MGFQNRVNHCFALNGNKDNPEIQGVQNIIETYRKALPQISLSGPTLFGPLLKQFLNHLIAQPPRLSYFIMLLLTDGVIHDMSQTKNLICQLAELPCSLIIIGVGDADFSAMDELDGDTNILTNSDGKSAARDIV